MTSSTFGALLYQLRKRAGMTQADLAAAVGYSSSFISGLEKGVRHVEWRMVVDRFVPALALHEEPGLAIRLVELAAAARGEGLPNPLSFEQKFKPASVTISQHTISQQSSHPLPNSPTALVGREADVRALINRFVGHSGRLMTLTGPPGVGKTRLALEAAARLKPQFEHGVRFIPLASNRDAERVALTIGSALEIPHNSKLSPQANLIHALRYKELLLVLDNFEQILPAAPFIAELLAECSRLHVLVTSREPNNVSGCNPYLLSMLHSFLFNVRKL
jgi:transcriptional regulator with XRE-family HTH domain